MKKILVHLTILVVLLEVLALKSTEFLSRPAHILSNVCITLVFGLLSVWTLYARSLVYSSDKLLKMISMLLILPALAFAHVFILFGYSDIMEFVFGYTSYAVIYDAEFSIWSHVGDIVFVVVFAWIANKDRLSRLPKTH